MNPVLPGLEAELARRAEADAASGSAATSRRRRWRPLGAAGVALTAAVGILLVLGLPFGDRARLDVVAEARAALDPAAAILHTVAIREVRTHDETTTIMGNGERRTGHVLRYRTERWSTARPDRFHEIFRDLAFSAYATDEEAYDAGRFWQTTGTDGRIRTRVVDATMAATIRASTVGASIARSGPFAKDPVVELGGLLRRGFLRDAGIADLGGRPVRRLVQADPAARVREARARQSDPSLIYPTEYLVDATSYEPVRITYLRPVGPAAGELDRTTITFTTFERLPVTPATKRLLRIDPSGRKVVDDPGMFTATKQRMAPRARRALRD